MTLSLSVRFDRPITDLPLSPGGYELLTADDTTYALDFCESTGGASTDDPTIGNWSMSCPDYAAFPEMKELRNRLHELVSISDCFIDTEGCCVDSNGRIDHQIVPHPIEILEFAIEDENPQTIADPVDPALLQKEIIPSSIDGAPAAVIYRFTAEALSKYKMISVISRTPML